MDWKNKLELPVIKGKDEMKSFWDGVSKSEDFIRDYLCRSEWLPVSTSNCEYGSIEDYMRIYCKENSVGRDNLFVEDDSTRDSPLERALYMAASQQVLFEERGENFYFDYSMGVHSECRIYFLRRLDE